MTNSERPESIERKGPGPPPGHAIAWYHRLATDPEFFAEMVRILKPRPLPDRRRATAPAPKG